VGVPIDEVGIGLPIDEVAILFPCILQTS